MECLCKVNQSCRVSWLPSVSHSASSRSKSLYDLGGVADNKKLKMKYTVSSKVLFSLLAIDSTKVYPYLKFED